MDSPKLVNLIQLFTAIAVLAGLGLVIWELQQTKEIALAEMAADGMIELANNNRSMIGETFGDVYAKSCADPSNLTDGEIVQLREHFETTLYHIRRLKLITELGDFGYSWEPLAKSYVEYWLGNEVGRLHFEQRVTSGSIEPEIQRIAEETLASGANLQGCRGLRDLMEKVRAPERLEDDA